MEVHQKIIISRQRIINVKGYLILTFSKHISMRIPFFHKSFHVICSCEMWYSRKNQVYYIWTINTPNSTKWICMKKEKIKVKRKKNKTFVWGRLHSFGVQGLWAAFYDYSLGWEHAFKLLIIRQFFCNSKKLEKQLF